MNRMTTIMTLAAGLGCAAPAALAQIEAEAIYWLVTPEGTGSVGIEEIAGTVFDVEDDLGYGDAEGAIGGSLYLGDAHQLGVNFLRLDISADNQLDKNIQYEDLFFRVNTEVNSSLEATLIRGFYRMNLGNEQVRGGIILGGQYLDFTGEVSSVDVGRASAEIQVGMPVVGGYLRIDPAPYLSLRGSATGLAWEFDDVDATYWDADGSVLLHLSQGPFAGVGYRYLSIDATDKGEAIDVDLTFSGPYAVAGFAW